MLPSFYVVLVRVEPYFGWCNNYNLSCIITELIKLVDGNKSNKILKERGPLKLDLHKN